MPDWAREVRTRLSSLRLSPTREAEIVEELSQHLDDRWRELIAGGAAPEEATRLTLAEFRDGDVLARHMAPLRQAHVPSSITPGVPTGHLLGDLWQDLRYARRTMAARPSFTFVAILSLALGIGANTAIFSLWNGVLHAPLPAVQRPDELVILSNPADSGSWTGRWDGRTDGPRSWLTYGEFEELRDHADAFSALMASQSSLSTWQVRVEGGTWEQARARLVSDEYFQVLGVRAAAGRVFTTGENRAEPTYAVISHPYWQRRFGGNPDVLGKTLTIRTATLSIVGVAPRGFIGETSGQQPDFWLPLRAQPSVLPGNDRLHDTPPVKVMWLHVFGRLRPDVTLSQANVQANAIFRAGLQSFYSGVPAQRLPEYLDQRLQLRSAAGGASPTRNEFSRSLTALLAAVGVLLLIACGNLASLLLARGAARRSEMAVRLSLGASRERLIRQLVTESLALAAIGGIAAIAVAYVLHGGLVRMMAEADPRFYMSFSSNPQVLAFVVVATVAAALLFGALPAWQITRAEAGEALKEQSRGATGTFGQLRSGRLLVSVQLALSLPLLVGAGLLARTVYNLQRADLGFPAERLALVRVDVREAGYEDARRESVLHELVGQIQRIPGVQAASFSQLGLFSGGESFTTIEVEGYTPKGDHDRGSALDVIGPGYFSTLHVPMRLGREILETDRGNAPNVCVINEAFAKRFFDQRNPIGMRITAVDENPNDRTTYHVVGVAKDAHNQNLRGDVAPRYFVAAKQDLAAMRSPTFLIRTATESSPVIAAVRRTIERVDAGLPILSASSIEKEMAPLTAQDRTIAQLAVVFGSVALMLAAIGLYGVLSYGVARRTGEIAIRIALGAQRGRVISMILRETAGLVSAGLAVGGGLAYAASRLIDSRLYGVTPQDPLTLALATGLLLFVTLSAAYVPAQRASRLDPMAALRQQ
jgi:putative ABC transport system permease protein